MSTAPASSVGDKVVAPLARLRGFHPGWFGAVMGTAIVGIVGYQNPGGIGSLQDLAHGLGVAFVAFSAILAIALGVPYVWRWMKHPDAARSDLANPVVGALYGTFPGGILVLAVGIATVGPSLWSAETTAWLVAVLAVVGGILAVAIGIVFAYLLFVTPAVGPESVNGGWFIPPVVTIIVGLVLLPLVPLVSEPDARLLIVIGYATWGMGFALFVLVAALLYERLVFHPLPAAPLAPSLWIGIGPIGVGSLALIRMAQAGTGLWGDAAPAVVAASALAALMLWGFGLWWLGAALLLLRRYLRQGPLPYGLGWWAFTFPLGAYTAGTLTLARYWHLEILEASAAVLFVALLAFWLVVSLRTIDAVRSGQVWRR